MYVCVCIYIYIYISPGCLGVQQPREPLPRGGQREGVAYSNIILYVSMVCYVILSHSMLSYGIVDYSVV